MFLGNASCIVAAAVLTYAPQHMKWLRLVCLRFLCACNSIVLATPQLVSLAPQVFVA